MDLNYLLSEQGIDTKKDRVLVMRHKPNEDELNKALPRLVVQKPDVFNTYQATQSIRTEKQLKKADYLASFIRDQGMRSIFVGFYRIGPSRTVTRKQYLNHPHNIELIEKYGMKGMGKERQTRLWFQLKPKKVFQEWKGKLIIDWPEPAIVWCRWAYDNNFPVRAILEESELDERVGNWYNLVLSWQDLHDISRRWIHFLSQLQCIYFILDETDGKGYVGSASGTENLYHRWMYYKATGHGGNKLLRKRTPEKFKFSILEVLSSGLTKDEIIQRENSWKERLHTKDYGLNAN